LVGRGLEAAGAILVLLIGWVTLKIAQRARSRRAANQGAE
jgi:hypothetical protein